jgi:aminoglycoside phosphotransferase (APT) family kinase protein
MGEGLAAIHSVPARGFGLLGIGGEGPFDAWERCFEATVRAALEELRVSPLSALLERAEERLRSWRDAARFDDAPRLLHGDAQPMNVLVQQSTIVAWLDWEFASGGDPRYELAYVETIFDRGWAVWADDAERARWRAAFYRGYGGDPFARDPERLAVYSLVHALRSTEFSSVMAPTLAPALREATVRELRARVLGLLDDR